MVFGQTIMENKDRGDASSNVVLPGDVVDVNNYFPPSTSKAGTAQAIIVGPGLRRLRPDSDQLAVTKCGIVRHQSNSIWIDTFAKRYVPTKGDQIIGTIVGKTGDAWKVDVGAADLALLNFLAFEGVTKRTKPTLKNGDLVFATVLLAIKDMEPEIVCIDGNGKSHGMGELSGDGLIFSVPLHVCRRIRHNDNPLLKLLGKAYKFEITVGANGRVWVRSERPDDMICIAKSIVDSEWLTFEQISTMVDANLTASANRHL